MKLKRLTEKQKLAYKENGYLAGLPTIFDSSEVNALKTGLDELTKLLKPGEKQNQINAWHRSSRWLYDLCSDPRILDYVEDLLGPNFYLWGSGFFSKEPKSLDVVSWHQDAPYWPLAPHNTVTVWIAFTDVDEANGAMRVIPGTHKAGLIEHSVSSDPNNVLASELGNGAFREEEAVSLLLKAGQISIHDDAIVHGSQANHSDRWRIGLTIRYSSTEVKCDLSKWPGFTAYLLRGVDEFNHNPKGIIPIQQFNRP